MFLVLYIDHIIINLNLVIKFPEINVTRFLNIFLIFKISKFHFPIVNNIN